jgi:transcription antitermination factor NusG
MKPLSGGADAPTFLGGCASSSARRSECLWHLLYVKSRQEKQLAEDLGAMNIDHFLPLVRYTRYYGTRKATVSEPLFAGYVFLRGTTEQAYEADRTKRVARIIRVANQKQMDWELANLQFALGQQIQPEPFHFVKKGMRVSVRSGPFQGLEGVVENLKANRIILQVQLLARAVSLEIDAGLLECV